MANALALDHILTRRPSAILTFRETDLARLVMDSLHQSLPTTTVRGLLAFRRAISVCFDSSRQRGIVDASAVWGCR